MVRPAFGFEQRVEIPSPVKARVAKPVGATAQQGTSVIPSPDDHVHDLDADAYAASTVEDVGVTGTAGNDKVFARGDHVHALTATPPSSGQFVMYNGSLWVPRSLELDDATDVTLTAPANGHVLKHDGTKWVNGPLALDDLSDVTVSAPAAGHMLVYSGSTWANDAGDYSNYTPTWTNLTVGNGVVTARYRVWGKTCHYFGAIEIGSTTSISGVFRVSLPVNASADLWMVGEAHAVDASASSARTLGGCEINTAIFGQTLIPMSNGTAGWNGTVPFTWSSSDVFMWSIVYRTA